MSKKKTNVVPQKIGIAYGIRKDTNITGWVPVKYTMFNNKTWKSEDLGPADVKGVAMEKIKHISLVEFYDEV